MDADKVVIDVELRLDKKLVDSSLSEIQKTMENLNNRKAELIDKKNLAQAAEDVLRLGKEINKVDEYSKNVEKSLQNIQNLLKQKIQFTPIDKNIEGTTEKLIKAQQKYNEALAKSMSAQGKLGAAANRYKNIYEVRTASAKKQIAELTALAEKYERTYQKAVDVEDKAQVKIAAAESRIAELRQQGLTSHHKEIQLLNQEIKAERNKIATADRAAELVKEEFEAKRAAYTAEQANAADNLKRAKNAAANARAGMQAAKERVNTLNDELIKLNEIARSEQKLAEYNKPRTDAEKQANEQIKEEVKQAKELEQTVKQIAEQESQLPTATKSWWQWWVKTLFTVKSVNKEQGKSSSQIYYALRAVKMAQFQLNRMEAFVKKLGQTSISVFKRFAKLMFTCATSFANLALSARKTEKSIKGLSKSTDNFNFSVKKGITFLVRYGLGIRSIYLAVNRLRQAMLEATGVMATQFPAVNTQVSALLSSINYLKAGTATFAQSLLSMLGPALAYIAEMFNKAAVAVASFISVLTGQKIVYKAIKTNFDYAASLDKSAKSAKDLKKELSGLDKLNVLTTPKDSGAGDTPSPYQWEEIPVDTKIKEMADKFKKLLDDLLKPIKDAWEKWGKFVVDSWKYAFDEVKKLMKSIGRDFMKVWSEAATERIFENLFQILGDIGLIIGNIAKGWREAWDWKNADGLTNGYRILAAIRDIILDIVQYIRYMADYTVEWTARLDWVPLFTAVADVLQKQVEPAIKNIMSLLNTIYQSMLNILGTWLIETALPEIIRMVGNVIEAIGIVAEKFEIAWKAYGAGNELLNNMIAIFDIILSHLTSLSEYTIQWANDLNFTPLLSSLNDWFVSLRGPIETLATIAENLYTTVVLPFMQFLIEEGLPRLLDMLTELNNKIDWDTIKTKVSEFLVVFEEFMEKAWDTFVIILEDLGNAFAEFVSSGKFSEIVDLLIKWMKEADPREMATQIEQFAVALVKLAIALKGLSILSNIAANMLTFANLFEKFNFHPIQLLGKAFSRLRGFVVDFIAVVPMLVNGTASITEALQLLFTPFEAIIMIIGGAIMAVTKFVDQFKNGFDIVKNILMGIGIAIAAIGAIILGAPAVIAAGIAGCVYAIATFVIALHDNWDAVKEWWKGVVEWWSEIPGKIADAVGGIKDKVVEKFNDIKEGLSNKFTEIKEGMTNALTDAKEAITTKFTEIKDGVGTKVSEIGTKYEELKESTHKALVEDIPFALGEAAGKMVYEIQHFSLKDALSELSRTIAEKSDEMHKKIDDWARGMGEKIGEFGKKFEDEVKNFGPRAKQWRDDVVNWANETNQNIDEWAKNVGTTIGQMGKDFEDNVKAWWEGVKAWGESIPEFWKGINDAFDEYRRAALDAWETFWKNLGQWLVDAIEEVKSWPGKIADGFLEGISKIGNDIVTAGKNFFAGFLSGYKEAADQHSPSRKMEEAGENTAQGLWNGITKKFDKIITDMSKLCNKLIKAATSALKPTALVSVGKNLITGLTNGIREGMSRAVEAIRNVATSVVNTARSVLRINSPSKVFYEIGEYISEGLDEGVEDGAKDVSDAFESLIPEDNQFASFETQFVDMIARMTQESTSLFDVMIDSMNDKLANLNVQDSFGELSAKLREVSKIDIPKIAAGFTLPTDINVNVSKQNSSDSKEKVDLSDLPDMLYDAFVEALSAMPVNNNGDIVVEIDGKSVFTAVRSQNDNYKKRTGGVSAFA